MNCSYYRNLKNKNIYFVESNSIIDCTNNRNGNKMVLYYKLKDNNELDSIDWDSGFVREVEEFKIKFEKVCD